MNDNQKEVIRELAARGPLESDRFLVGRDSDLVKIESCAVGPAQHNSAWLYGPRNIGKSSLAKCVCRRGEASGTHVIWNDVSDLRAPATTEFIERSLRQVDSGAIEGASAWERLDSLARSSRDRPVLLVYDGFETPALWLLEDDQRKLRQLVNVHAKFAYLFISRSEPAQLMERFPDKSSRLLDLVGHHRVEPLDIGGVDDLVVEVFDTLKVSPPETLADQIWERVGGLPVAVLTMLQAVAIELLAPKRGVDRVLERTKSEVESCLLAWWWDLQPRSRIFLAEADDGKPRPDIATCSALELDGLIRRDRPVRPRWLGEVGRSEGAHEKRSPAPSRSIDPTIRQSPFERIHSLISQVSERILTDTGAEWFRPTGEQLKYYHCTRPDCSEADFEKFLSHLYKMLVEATSEHASDGRQYRLPAHLVAPYKGQKSSPTPVWDVTTLRHKCEHLSRSGQSESDAQLVASILERYGCRHPATNADREQLRANILDAVGDHLEDILRWACS